MINWFLQDYQHPVDPESISWEPDGRGLLTCAHAPYPVESEPANAGLASAAVASKTEKQESGNPSRYSGSATVCKLGKGWTLLGPGLRPAEC